MEIIVRYVPTPFLLDMEFWLSESNNFSEPLFL